MSVTSSDWDWDTDEFATLPKCIRDLMEFIKEHPESRVFPENGELEVNTKSLREIRKKYPNLFKRRGDRAKEEG